MTELSLSDMLKEFVDNDFLIEIWRDDNNFGCRIYKDKCSEFDEISYGDMGFSIELAVKQVYDFLVLKRLTYKTA